MNIFNEERGWRIRVRWEREAENVEIKKLSNQTGRKKFNEDFF